MWILIILIVCVFLIFILKSGKNDQQKSVLSKSMEKTRIMNRVISCEKNNDPNLSEERYKLYNFLRNYSEIFEGAFSDLTFTQFSNAIDFMKAKGFLYSSHGDYLPIASFCFVHPLAFASSFFGSSSDMELTWDEVSQQIIWYFENN